MSGHSKWSTIKRQKGVADARRGQLFTKLTKEIMVAVRDGGSNPEHNVRLRLLIQKCRDNNMPSDNIERAIKKASGEAGGGSLVEATFEGYGPGGTAMLIQVLSDNRNRALQEIRSVLNRGGGTMAEAGAVSWMFETKGVITVDTSQLDAEEVALWAIDAGAEDVKVEQGYLEVYTEADKLETARQALEEKNVPIASAELSMVPTTMVELDEDDAIRALRLLDKLEELDDVQRVFSNVDFPEEVLEKLRARV
ncbi:MAG: YebC/PmpR family DNA-binding transcriptional regulator [Chloroflexi bacterium]|nr:MAG: YebC/PmpR family DNA-binding transcriptional regulator [Chloroflexota bacterium]